MAAVPTQGSPGPAIADHPPPPEAPSRLDVPQGQMRLQESQPFAASAPLAAPALEGASAITTHTGPLLEPDCSFRGARPAVDHEAQTTPSLFFAALRRITSSFSSSSPALGRDNDDDDDDGDDDGLNLSTKLNALVGYLLFRRPLRNYGSESLIVPFVCILALIGLLLTLLTPLWTSMYNTHVSARVRLLQRQQTLHLTPKLVASLRAPPFLPPDLAPPAQVYDALYRLCLAESPHGPACEATKHHLLVSSESQVLDVLDASRAVRAALETGARAIEAEWVAAKTLELDLGVRNASSRELQALVEGLDAVIVHSMHLVRTAVAVAAVNLDTFRDKVVRDAVLGKLRADRDRLVWQMDTQGQVKAAQEVVNRLDQLVAALRTWVAALDQVGRQWAEVLAWTAGADQASVLWWVPRHLWPRVQQAQGEGESTLVITDRREL